MYLLASFCIFCLFFDSPSSTVIDGGISIVPLRTIGVPKLTHSGCYERLVPSSFLSPGRYVFTHSMSPPPPSFHLNPPTFSQRLSCGGWSLLFFAHSESPVVNPRLNSTPSKATPSPLDGGHPSPLIWKLRFSISKTLRDFYDQCFPSVLSISPLNRFLAGDCEITAFCSFFFR